MKQLLSILALLTLAFAMPMTAQAQNVQEKPNITYTAEHPKYILA